MRLMAIAISAWMVACTRADVASLATAPVLPSRPPEPTNSLTWIWGMAVDESGVCIARATATVVRGQGLGQTIAQTTPCGAWDYGGGFVLNDLTPGVEMTIRVSAPGHVLQDKTIVPFSGAQRAVLFVLVRKP